MQNLYADDLATPIGVASESADRLQLALTDIAQVAREWITPI